MNIKIKGFINISCNANKVFGYVSNLENDPFWRKENLCTRYPTLKKKGLFLRWKK